MSLPRFSFERATSQGFKKMYDGRIPFAGVKPEYLINDDGSCVIILKESGGDYVPHAGYIPKKHAIMGEPEISQRVSEKTDIDELFMVLSKI